jgi:protein-S-isoprenylcysteine O-methyltransferase Ste14
LVPWLIVRAGRTGGGTPLGWALAGSGLTLVGWCVLEFYRRGRGTLAPWDPPRALVRAGAYRFTRNPMYLGLLVHLAGWAVAAGSWWLASYAGLVAVAFHLRVVRFEERWLKEQFPAEWAEYSGRVPRWLIALR